MKQLKVITAETENEYLKRLAALGIKKLGVGAYSTVFQHPEHPNVAVKVSKAGNFNKWSSCGALAWSEWCKENPSTYVPKIYSIHKIPADKSGQGIKLLIVLMEKLKPATRQKVFNFIGEKGLIEVLIPMAAHNTKWYINDKHFETISDPELKKVLLKLDELGKNHGLDLRVDNFLLRGSQVVFVDPLY